MHLAKQTNALKKEISYFQVKLCVSLFIKKVEKSQSFFTKVLTQRLLCVHATLRTIRCAM